MTALMLVYAAASIILLVKLRRTQWLPRFDWGRQENYEERAPLVQMHTGRLVTDTVANVSMAMMPRSAAQGMFLFSLVALPIGGVIGGIALPSLFGNMSDPNKMMLAAQIVAAVVWAFIAVRLVALVLVLVFSAIPVLLVLAVVVIVFGFGVSFFLPAELMTKAWSRASSSTPNQSKAAGRYEKNFDMNSCFLSASIEYMGNIQAIRLRCDKPYNDAQAEREKQGRLNAERQNRDQEIIITKQREIRDKLSDGISLPLKNPRDSLAGFYSGLARCESRRAGGIEIRMIRNGDDAYRAAVIMTTYNASDPAKSRFAAFAATVTRHGTEWRIVPTRTIQADEKMTPFSAKATFRSMGDRGEALFLVLEQSDCKYKLEKYYSVNPW
jgi:ABC-type multidrug transport system fused ATPase/permease subunit